MFLLCGSAAGAVVVAAAVIAAGAVVAAAGSAAAAAAADQNDQNDEPDAGIVFKAHGNVHLTLLILNHPMRGKRKWQLGRGKLFFGGRRDTAKGDE